MEPEECRGHPISACLSPAAPPAQKQKGTFERAPPRAAALLGHEAPRSHLSRRGPPFRDVSELPGALKAQSTFELLMLLKLQSKDFSLETLRGPREALG